MPRTITPETKAQDLLATADTCLHFYHPTDPEAAEWHLFVRRDWIPFVDVPPGYAFIEVPLSDPVHRDIEGWRARPANPRMRNPNKPYKLERRNPNKTWKPETPDDEEIGGR
jgi:hypothetical protein